MVPNETTASRGKWKTKWEFIFSCLGSLVGLGNIWRFPYVCFKNGGGAFLIPYLIFMVLCALPLIFIEFTYCQYSSLGPGKVWICCPLFKGIGYGMVLWMGIVGVYYNVILSWTLYYLGMSLNPTLPWSTCDNEWNTDSCYTRKTNLTHVHSNHTLFQNHNQTVNFTYLAQKKTSAEEFWERNVLELSDGIDTPGVVRWQLVICLFSAWAATFLVLFKGIKTSGKVVYVAATMPYLLLSILFIRSMVFSLDGAWNGLKVYLVPRWDDLLNFSVWVDAAVQTFYSVGLGTGGPATLASYNNFNNNCYRDALILPILDVLTSLFAGCVVFATLGIMAQESGLSVDNVVDSGPGIAFMVYPEAVSKLPLPQLWSVLFFITLFTVGLDSMIVHVQTCTAALTDNIPSLSKHGTLLTGALCLLGFICGLPCITQGGVYVLTLIDWYCAGMSLMCLAFLEVSVLAWIYGADRLYSDINIMVGYFPNGIWKVMWRFITPITIVFVWVFNIIRHRPVEYGVYQYPGYALAIGWIIAILPMLNIPIGMIHTLVFGAKGTLRNRMRLSLRPTSEWRTNDNPKLDEEHDPLNGKL